MATGYGGQISLGGKTLSNIQDVKINVGCTGSTEVDWDTGMQFEAERVCEYNGGIIYKSDGKYWGEMDNEVVGGVCLDVISVKIMIDQYNKNKEEPWVTNL